VRDLLKRLLEEQEARVEVCDSAHTALEALKHTRPDVIVSDVGMPQVDGYQFMRSLRASEAPGDRIPALALTAFARAEDRKRSLLAGYQAHIAKPFDLGELVLLVANLAGR
jgi:CheY-like chemotaxis protein